MTDDMLDLARRNEPLVAEQTGYRNVEFRNGMIQDLKTNLALVEEYLADNPVQTAADYHALNAKISEFKRDKPLVEDNSVDIIVSNCVLNLVSDKEKKQLFEEMFRVLRPGGRIAISDIVSDEVSPEHLKNDERLWSGCISGAFQEREFIELLEAVGFIGTVIDKWEEEPWQIVEGIEYRSMTVLAWKPSKAQAYDKNQAVIYKGPWAKVVDEAGREYIRGERSAVSDVQFDQFTKAPYADQLVLVNPVLEVEEAQEYSCCRPNIRSPKETKAGVLPATSDPNQGSCCQNIKGDFIVTVIIYCR